MKRLTSLLAATVLGASLLTSCSGSSTDDYCDSLKSAEQDFADFGEANFDNFDDFIDRVDDFAADAPDEVKDDWKVLADALEAFADALEEAGIDMTDLAGMQSGQIPEGVDVAKLTEAMGKIQELGSGDFEKATEAIEKHAKAECDIDLGADS
ncbi:hypothetical protein [Nocardioides sp.]|uniref:hypothetical protein n=1 Tax=Nocardioides sp. TaxID=35761 RepID=UPI00356948B0